MCTRGNSGSPQPHVFRKEMRVLMIHLQLSLSASSWLWLPEEKGQQAQGSHLTLPRESFVVREILVTFVFPLHGFQKKKKKEEVIIPQVEFKKFWFPFSNIVSRQNQWVLLIVSWATTSQGLLSQLPREDQEPNGLSPKQILANKHNKVSEKHFSYSASSPRPKICTLCDRSTSFFLMMFLLFFHSIKAEMDIASSDCIIVIVICFRSLLGK